MFQVTLEKINQAMDNANYILSRLSQEYKRPAIREIKITNATSYWGRIGFCCKRFNTYKMWISREFERCDETMAMKRLEECIIHEFIHTMPGRMNHGPKFKQMCRIVNSNTNYTINTTDDGEEYGYERRPAPEPKYHVVCKDCSKVFKYCRLPKYPVTSYRCSCGSKNLELIKL